MRRSASQPVGYKKKASGGCNSVDQKERYVRALAAYKEFQSGRDLSNGYKLGQHIAAGADGDVYRGFLPVQRKEVAIKRIKVSSNVIQRHIHQEIAAAFHARKRYGEEVFDATSKGHPCIVAYLDWFAGSGGPEREVCIVMDLCNFGVGDLVYTGGLMRVEYDKTCSRQAPLMQAGAKSARDPRLYRFPEREILKVMFQMLSALAFLNRHGIFHRDVKSENILWEVAVPEGMYKLADFGVAFCEADADPSKRHDDCGTLWTMAPELLVKRSCNAAPGPSCDTWSLGVVLFEMAFYEKPFNSLELLAYRNTGLESQAGFWASLCGLTKRPGTPPTARWGAPPKPINSSPSGVGRMRKQGSLPSLASVCTNFTHGESTSTPSSPSSSTSPSGSRAIRSLPSSPKLLRALPRSNTGASIGSVAGSEEDAASPSVSLQARKRTFLRKRSPLKWIYSEELRSCIFDDMLEEDIFSRPAPAELLAGDRFQSLLACCDSRRWGPEGMAPRPCVVNEQIRSAGMESSSPGEDAVEEKVSPGTATTGSEATVFLGIAPQRAQKILRQMTPENFYEVLQVEVAMKEASKGTTEDLLG